MRPGRACSTRRARSDVADKASVVAKLQASVADVQAIGVVAAPTITNARATPSSLPAGGGSVVIDATVANATQVMLDGAVVTLPVTVNVPASHTFALVAHGAPPDAQASITVTVQSADPTLWVPFVTPAPGRALGAPGFYTGGQDYDRFQILQEISGPTTLTARTADNFAFGQAMALTLTADGAPIANATTSTSASSVTFTLTQAAFNALPAGWARLSISGVPTAWGVVLDTAMFVLKGAASQSWMPVYSGSYEFKHPIPNAVKTHTWAKVPAAWDPITHPLPPRVCPAFSTAPGRDQLVMTLLSPYRAEDVHRPTVNANGVISTAFRQNYFFFDWQASLPLWPLLDGPRGRGSIVCPTSIWIGRTLPEGPKHYGCDSWRVFEEKADGTVKTLAGYRDSGASMPRYWQEDVVPELVGDWSAIPVARRGFHEAWDFIFAQFSITTDPNAPPIGGEPPHFAPGPVGYVADTQNDRVCKLQFSATDREATAVVTEFLTGLGNPWNLAEFYVGTTHYLLVSERTANRVSMWDQTTKQLVKSYPITGPEGLRVMDGYALVGSKATAAVWKIDLTTDAITKVRDLATPTPYLNNNSMFVNLAISDGTFGPRGMFAVVTWSNNNSGLPFLFNANGSEIVGWQYQGSARPGMPWAGIHVDSAGVEEAALSYPTAVSIGGGRMVFGTVQEGLYMLSKALPADVQPDYTKYLNGLKEWRARGFDEVYGHRGWNLYGQVLPWGVSANIDYYMTTNEHVKP